MVPFSELSCHLVSIFIALSQVHALIGQISHLDAVIVFNGTGHGIRQILGHATTSARFSFVLFIPGIEIGHENQDGYLLSPLASVFKKGHILAVNKRLILIHGFCP